MNTILSSQLLEKEMSQPLSFTLAVFLGAAIGGYYCMDVVKRWRALETQVAQIKTDVSERMTIEETHSLILEDMDQRLREKQDYDESDEIQEGIYQAWKGDYTDEMLTCEIRLWRKKLRSFKDNQEWVSHSYQHDGAVVARDYYLGNLHPEFHWDVQEEETVVRRVASETFVETWESVIHLKISMTFLSIENRLDLGDAPGNARLKELLEKNLIQWQRVLSNPQ